MSLKNLVGEKVLNDVLRSVKTPGQWRALVVDSLGMRVISTCCKMRDIVMEGITIVEDLNKGRQSLPLEAIYFVSPSENSVQTIIDDFKDPNKPQYTGAHIFFTETCPENLFEKIAKANNLGRRIKNLQEINIAYLPTEMQVFSLDNRDALPHLYSHSQSIVKDKRPVCVEQIAEQLATLCASLGEYPSIRYRSASQLSLDIAQALMNRMQAYKADDPSIGEGPQKQQSQLIILDRGFDLVSPLLHELTYQSMVYDLLNIENDVYKYEVQSSGDYIMKEALLDENDEQWVKLRHKHIANVSNEITSMIKDFSESKRLTGPGTKQATTIKDLSLLLKKMPQYQKELSKYSLHLNLAEECLRIYNQKQIEKLCAVEQDLATGVDKDGEKISKDHMRAIVPVLLDTTISEHNKLRIILLYAIMKQGITEESMNKLMEHAKISSFGRNTIKNVSNLDVTIIQNSDKGVKKKNHPQRKERTGEFQLSRYVPYVKDIMEDAVEGKLDNKMFPFLLTREGGGIMAGGSSARSARMNRNWHKDKPQAESRIVPRLIVFIVGGASFSETRCAYEVTEAYKQWEVIIGGSELLTPEGFLYRIQSLG